MNLKSAVKYQIMDGRIAIPVFYLVMFSVMVLFSISVSGLGEEHSRLSAALRWLPSFFYSWSGSTLFVKLSDDDAERHFQKDHVQGYVITVLILSIGMSLINAVMLWIGKAMVATKDNVLYRSLFEQLYEMRYAGNTGGFSLFWKSSCS